MPIPQMPGAGLTSIDDVINYVIRLERELRFLMEGGLDSTNMFEAGGWRINPNQLASIDGKVGMSTLTTTGDDIRFWSGDVISGSPTFYVTKGGFLYAINATLKGHIDALSGTIGGFTIDLTKLSGAGIIEGGTIRTAAPGNKRIELSGNSFSTYTTGDILQGIQWGQGFAGTTYGDVGFFDSGVETFRIYNKLAGNGWVLRPMGSSSTSSLGIGWTGYSTFAHGDWHFDGSVDLGPNTATGTVQYANYATAAGSAGTASSVDWSNVTNHPDGTATPQMDGSATAGISSLYSRQDHVHPKDTSKQDTITGAASTITSSNLTVSRALASDSSGKVAVSAVTSTELGYVSGVTSAIQAQLDGKASKTLPSWSAPTLLNGWVNFGTPYAAAGYYKDDMGIVRLKGVIKSGSTGLNIFTLPTGYRPAEQHIFSGVSNNGSYQLTRIDVHTDGTITMEAGGNSYLSLSNISFRAEQ